jgi:hypothetical protein
VLFKTNGASLAMRKISIYKFIELFFPTFMVLLEVGIRFVLRDHDRLFVGPTLATSGLGLLMPLFQPKEVRLPANITLPEHAKLTHRGDEVLRAVVLLILIATVVAWYSTCVLALQKDSFILSAVIGVITYFVALGASLIKENL